MTTPQRRIMKSGHYLWNRAGKIFFVRYPAEILRLHLWFLQLKWCVGLFLETCNEGTILSSDRIKHFSTNHFYMSIKRRIFSNLSAMAAATSVVAGYHRLFEWTGKGKGIACRWTKSYDRTTLCPLQWRKREARIEKSAALAQRK
jgi:hypothetical protein